jgi:Zn-finger nucleic acid-binding protein
MNCPKCLEAMKPVAFEGIEVDRCPRCGGLFFDATELNRLLPLRGAERIDDGRPSTGHELDRIPHVHCPRCLEQGIEIKMITMVDADRPQIRFERCPDCGGSHLDAGEFHELKRNTLVNFLHHRLTKQSERKGVMP